MIPSSAPKGSSSSIAGRAEQDRAQERGALAHAARELPRPRRLEAAEAEALEQRPRALARRGARARPASSRPIATLSIVRRQGSSASRWGMKAQAPSATGAPSIERLAARRRLEPREDLEERALARAARADQRDELAGRRDQVDARRASGAAARRRRRRSSRPRGPPARAPPAHHDASRLGRRAPAQHRALDRGDDREQHERQQRADDHRAEHEVGVVAVLGERHVVAEPLRRADVLGEDRRDVGEGDRRPSAR